MIKKISDFRFFFKSINSNKWKIDRKQNNQNSLWSLSKLSYKLKRKLTHGKANSSMLKLMMFLHYYYNIVIMITVNNQKKAISNCKKNTISNCKKNKISNNKNSVMSHNLVNNHSSQ